MEFLSNAVLSVVSIIAALIALWCALSCACECSFGIIELWSKTDENVQKTICGTFLGVMAIATVVTLAILSRHFGWGL